MRAAIQLSSGLLLAGVQSRTPPLSPVLSSPNFRCLMKSRLLWLTLHVSGFTSSAFREVKASQLRNKRRTCLAAQHA